jgi:Domain of unknown function (DUF4157)
MKSFLLSGDMGKRKFIQRSKKSSKTDDHKPFIPVQAKMLINQPNDAYEVEADKMADNVVSSKADGATPSVSPVTPSITPVQLQKASDKEDAVSVQSKEQHVASATATKITGAKSSGRPLEKKVKNTMENSFGADFSKVRVHTGVEAEQMSEGLNAQAFTHENNVFFNRGKYNPETREGKHLLAHELTHTLQQKGMVQKKIQRSFEPKDAVAEMIGKKFKIDRALKVGNVSYAANTTLTITIWKNGDSSVTGNAVGSDKKSSSISVKKIYLQTIGDTKSGLDQYTAGADKQAQKVEDGATEIASHQAKKGEFEKMKNLKGYEAELKRLQGLQATREESLNEKLIQETMYNTFDSGIKKWTDFYNKSTPYKPLLDANIVKSMLYEETKLGTSGTHLEKPPYSWTDGKKNPIRSRYNLGQAIDSWGPQQYLMIKEMSPTIYAKYGLSVLEKKAVWKGMTNEDFASWNGGKFWEAVKEFNSAKEKGKNLMGDDTSELFYDYDFWIRTAIRWLFEKRSDVSSWSEAVKAYNGGGSKATGYRDRVIKRVTNKKN